MIFSHKNNKFKVKTIIYCPDDHECLLISYLAAIALKNKSDSYRKAIAIVKP